MLKFPETGQIDLGGLASQSDEMDREIADALTGHRSFVAVNLPFEEGTRARVERMTSLFDLPEAAKKRMAVRKYAAGNANIYRGYYPFPETRSWSYRENFDVGPEPVLTCPECEGKQAFEEANVWPVESELPGWREAVLSYMQICRGLGVEIALAAARGLGRDEKAVREVCAGRNGSLRLLHYAEVPGSFELDEQPGEGERLPEDGRRVVARAHVDTGLISLLWQDAAGGLQMQGADDVWREVPPVGDGISVHCGTLLERLTGGEIKATPHRVLGGLGERHSIAYFVEPDFSTTILPPELEGEISYADYLCETFPGRFAALKA